MKEDIQEYFGTLKTLLDEIIATDANGEISVFDEAVEGTVRMIMQQAFLGRKLMFIGNGASAAIASHMATDFWKNGGVRAVAFNDPAGLTCAANDFGYPHVFEKPIEMFADAGDILIAISSSGKSENILRSVKAARDKGVHVITLSGFADDNPLRKLGDVNFYVPISHYGYVETIHQAICHCWVDMVIGQKKGKDGQIQNRQSQACISRPQG